MPLLRRREIVADEWVTLGDSPPADDVPLIVPFATFRENPGAYRARKGKLGIRLLPADNVEDLAPELPHVSLVALEFTSPGEGRGYTQARLLRARYKFAGEIRAVGHVKQDQVYLMSRVGIDAFDLSPDEKAEEVVATLERVRVAYGNRPHRSGNTTSLNISATSSADVSRCALSTDRRSR